eukprot:14477474-Alexandrium_andersonii.AAC.1
MPRANFRSRPSQAPETATKTRSTTRDRKARRNRAGTPRPSSTLRDQPQLNRSKALLWSAKTAAGHLSTA